MGEFLFTKIMENYSGKELYRNETFTAGKELLIGMAYINVKTPSSAQGLSSHARHK
jgi:hypothetical protein